MWKISSQLVVGKKLEKKEKRQTEEKTFLSFQRYYINFDLLGHILANNRPIFNLQKVPKYAIQGDCEK